jgi:glycosyltransferase involved in cell wall biosynthesis
MRILIATDAFPPVSGGSGWSTYELARGLRARGHHLIIVEPYAESAPKPYDGFELIGFPASAPSVPFVRNYYRNERLYRRLAAYLSKLILEERIDVIHAQHELTGPASVRAAKATGIPCVCMVRDPDAGDTCPGCSPGAMTRCLPPRAGSAWPVTLPFIPYMRANLRQKQRDLAGADAIVAVSGQVAAYLRDRSPDLANARIETIPNGVDVTGMRACVRASSSPLDRPYALFIGKLARNKGVTTLVDVVERAKLEIPLIVIGDGSERQSLMDAASRASVEINILEWLDRQEVFRWLGHASFLIFPSNWPEPLSRVLLEASALCVPIAAMNTGGTSDVITDEETGLLSSSPAELTEDVARLASNAALRERLGLAAGERAERLFDASVVVRRMEQLYEDLVA